MSYSYLHRYHAGCFADVHKHLILIAILQHLRKKTTPFCVLDSHAGEGLYDLNCTESQKNAEHNDGFLQLLKLDNSNEIISAYLNLIQTKENHYPGSPAIIANFLNTQDQGIFIENHPQAFVQLQQFVKRQKVLNLHVHQRDAYEALIALLPLKQKRGLVFIDPSYEVKSEYHSIVEVLQKAYLRFSHGIFALWYPILKENYHKALIKKTSNNFEKIWHSEWRLKSKQEETGLLGSGMIIINPPYQLDLQINQTFTLLEPFWQVDQT